MELAKEYERWRSFMLGYQDARDLTSLGFPPAPEIYWEACEGLTPSLKTSTSRPTVNWSPVGGPDNGNSGSPTTSNESGAPESWSASSPTPPLSSTTLSPPSTTTSPSTNLPRPTPPVAPTERLKEVSAGLTIGYPITIGAIVILIIISGLVSIVVWYVRF